MEVDLEDLTDTQLSFELHKLGLDTAGHRASKIRTLRNAGKRTVYIPSSRPLSASYLKDTGSQTPLASQPNATPIPAVLMSSNAVSTVSTGRGGKVITDARYSNMLVTNRVNVANNVVVGNVSMIPKRLSLTTSESNSQIVSLPFDGTFNSFDVVVDSAAAELTFNNLNSGIQAYVALRADVDSAVTFSNTFVFPSMYTMFSTDSSNTINIRKGDAFIFQAFGGLQSKVYVRIVVAGGTIHGQEILIEGPQGRRGPVGRVLSFDEVDQSVKGSIITYVQNNASLSSFSNVPVPTTYDRGKCLNVTSVNTDGTFQLGFTAGASNVTQRAISLKTAENSTQLIFDISAWSTESRETRIINTFTINGENKIEDTTGIGWEILGFPADFILNGGNFADYVGFCGLIAIKNDTSNSQQKLSFNTNTFVFSNHESINDNAYLFLNNGRVAVWDIVVLENGKIMATYYAEGNFLSSAQIKPTPTPTLTMTCTETVTAPSPTITLTSTVTLTVTETPTVTHTHDPLTIVYEGNGVYADSIKVFSTARICALGEFTVFETTAPPAPTPTITAPTPTITAPTPTVTVTAPTPTVTVTAPTPTITAPTPTVTITAPTPTITAPTPTITAQTPTITAPTPTITAPTPTITAPTPTMTITAPTPTVTITAPTGTAKVLESSFNIHNSASTSSINSILTFTEDTHNVIDITYSTLAPSTINGNIDRTHQTMRVYEPINYDTSNNAEVVFYVHGGNDMVNCGSRSPNGTLHHDIGISTGAYIIELDYRRPHLVYYKDGAISDANIENSVVFDDYLQVKLTTAPLSLISTNYHGYADLVARSIYDCCYQFEYILRNMNTSRITQLVDTSGFRDTGFPIHGRDTNITIAGEKTSSLICDYIAYMLPSQLQLKTVRIKNLIIKDYMSSQPTSGGAYYFTFRRIWKSYLSRDNYNITTSFSQVFSDVSQFDFDDFFNDVIASTDPSDDDYTSRRQTSGATIDVFYSSQRNALKDFETLTVNKLAHWGDNDSYKITRVPKDPNEDGDFMAFVPRNFVSQLSLFKEQRNYTKVLDTYSTIFAQFGAEELDAFSYTDVDRSNVLRSASRFLPNAPSNIYVYNDSSDFRFHTKYATALADVFKVLNVSGYTFKSGSGREEFVKSRLPSTTKYSINNTTNMNPAPTLRTNTLTNMIHDVLALSTSTSSSPPPSSPPPSSPPPSGSRVYFNHPNAATLVAMNKQTGEIVDIIAHQPGTPISATAITNPENAVVTMINGQSIEVDKVIVGDSIQLCLSNTTVGYALTSLESTEYQYDNTQVVSVQYETANNGWTSFVNRVVHTETKRVQDVSGATAVRTQLYSAIKIGENWYSSMTSAGQEFHKTSLVPGIRYILYSNRQFTGTITGYPITYAVFNIHAAGYYVINYPLSYELDVASFVSYTNAAHNGGFVVRVLYISSDSAPTQASVFYPNTNTQGMYIGEFAKAGTLMFPSPIATPTPTAPTPTVTAPTPTVTAPTPTAPTPTVTAPTPTVTAPTPTVTAPTPTVTAPTPTVTAPTPTVTDATMVIQNNMVNVNLTTELLNMYNNISNANAQVFLTDQNGKLQYYRDYLSSLISIDSFGFNNFATSYTKSDGTLFTTGFPSVEDLVSNGAIFDVYYVVTDNDWVGHDRGLKESYKNENERAWKNGNAHVHYYVHFGTVDFGDITNTSYNGTLTTLTRSYCTVTFTLTSTTDQQYYIAGFFNNWTPQPMTSNNNTHSIDLTLIINDYCEFLFVQGDIWESFTSTDATNNPNVLTHNFGYTNRYINVLQDATYYATFNAV